MLVEFVENRLTENHAVLVTHDRPVGAVMVILPGGEPWRISSSVNCW